MIQLYPFYRWGNGFWGVNRIAQCHTDQYGLKLLGLDFERCKVEKAKGRMGKETSQGKQQCGGLESVSGGSGQTRWSRARSHRETAGVTMETGGAGPGEGPRGASAWSHRTAHAWDIPSTLQSTSVGAMKALSKIPQLQLRLSFRSHWGMIISYKDQKFF